MNKWFKLKLMNKRFKLKLMNKRFKLKLMNKWFKLKLPNGIPLLQFCRSKNPSSFPETPVPVIYRVSPVNHKVSDNIHSSLTVSPSSPDYHSIRRHVSSKIDPSRSPPCALYYYSDYSTERSRYKHKTSPFVTSEKYYVNKQRKKKEKKIRERAKIRPGKLNYKAEEEEEESEAIIDSSRSFSMESSIEYSTTLDDIIFNEIYTSSCKVNKNKRKDQNRRALNCKGLQELNGFYNSSAKTVSFKEGKAKDSFAVVKKSEDPYEDFKRSMLEMIMEKQMFETRELEELLHCFLALNSNQYRGVIVEAFSEIWEVLFCDSTIVKHRASFGL